MSIIDHIESVHGVARTPVIQDIIDHVLKLEERVKYLEENPCPCGRPFIVDKSLIDSTDKIGD